MPAQNTGNQWQLFNVLTVQPHVCMYILGDGKYADGTNQNDIQLLYNFIHICKNYGGYEGK